MVPQSWMINCLKKYKISGEVRKFIENNLENRRDELIARGKSLTKVKIKRIIPGRRAITIIISNSDDATQSHT